MKRNSFRLVCCLISIFLSSESRSQMGSKISAEEIRTIAKEAYIYGYPLVDNYRIGFSYFVDSNSPEFKAGWNQITNIPRVYTPKDSAVQTPNSDTPYSWAGLDLRGEPIVLSLPDIEKNRYYSVQFTDAYTFNFAYLGTRTTGNDAGRYMVVGPGWKGETPKGVKKIIRSETDFIVLVYRTQLFGPDDIDNVKKIQAGYKIQGLSSYLGSTSAPDVEMVNFIKPISQAEQKTSLEFFSILNFALRYCPTDGSEIELMKRFSKIGVGAGLNFDTTQFTPEIKTALEQGRADAWKEFAGGVNELSQGKLKAGDLFGTRAYMKNNYLNRWLGTIGIYGNSKQEAMYPVYYTDSKGNKLNGSSKYTLHFSSGQYPPVNAFWSLTIYGLPASLLVSNTLNRYLINSPMLPNLKKDADGGLTLYVQNKSPGKDLESNWLPSPDGPFSAYLRMYWPKEEALNGTWQAPKLIQIH
jgi:hypothetical protein